MRFNNKLQHWYEIHKRDLPWRANKDPYSIWLSEILLQQTRVSQGLGYYNRYIQDYPTVEAFAAAPIDDLLQKWQGLGYYSRCRNMHATAKVIVNDYAGQFPTSYKTLLSLKGIGPYTAAAIASIAFNAPIPVIDGNVIRVLTRVFGISDSVQNTATLKLLQSIANDLISYENPGDYNQAIMEFGALHCTPKAPKCGTCIFQLECVALQKNMISKIPFKDKKIKKQPRHLLTIRVDFEDSTYILKNPDSGIWAGLYTFPIIELQEAPDATLVQQTIADLQLLKPILLKQGQIKHVLTHQSLSIHYIHLQVLERSSQREWMEYKIKTLNRLGFPIFFKKIGFI